MTKQELKERAKRKAQQSECVYSVSALGLNKRGELIGATTNKYRFIDRAKGNIHAEISLIHKYGKELRTIIICRVGNGGAILPISACENCQKVANAMNIKIISIQK